MASAEDPLRDVSRMREELFKGLLNSGDFSDLKVICRGKEYRVHKAIVCPQSGFFDRACKSDFKEGKSGEIVLKGDDRDELRMDDPSLVQHMMEFFYQFDYLPDQMPQTGHNTSGFSFADPAPSRSLFGNNGGFNGFGTLGTPPSPSPPANSGANIFRSPPPANPPGFGNSSLFPSNDPPQAKNLVTHTQVYALAEYYGVATLKATALSKFRNAAAVYWNSPGFVQAAKAVFSTTVDGDTGLREIVKNTLMKHSELIRKPELEPLFLQHSALTYQLLKERF